MEGPTTEQALMEIAKRYDNECRIDEDSKLDDAFEPAPSSVSACALNLARIPVAEWDSLTVSRRNTFADAMWDWRQEGSPIYKDYTYFSWDKEISPGVRLLDTGVETLLRLLKALLFYSLPQNAVVERVNSFSTTLMVANQLLRLAKFLYKNGVYVDLEGNGRVAGAGKLTKKHFTEFYEKECTTAYSKYEFVKRVVAWQNLSKGEMLPKDFCLSNIVFDAESLRKIGKQLDEARGAYLPIGLDTLGVLVPFAADMVENDADDILFVYDKLWPVIAGEGRMQENNFDWDKALSAIEKRRPKVCNLADFIDDRHTMSFSLATKLRNIILKHPGWRTHTDYDSDIWRIKRTKIVKIAQELGINLYAFSKATFYDIPRIKDHVKNLATTLRTACFVIIMLTTGMRRSEALTIEAGKCWEVKGRKDDYRLKFIVWKTSDSSQGDEVTLPIPKITYLAVKCLEKLTEQARKDGETTYLSVNITNYFGKEMGKNSFNRMFHNLCDDLGIEERIHSHQFRKTIASYAIYRDPRNLGVIKRLFSHRSLAMTLSYIIKLPGMTEEFKSLIISQNVDLLAELIDAAEKDEIGGIGGQRVKQTLKGNKRYFARMNDDGQDTLEEYVATLLSSGFGLLHRTEYGAICVNTHCALSHLGSETCQCNVVDCNFAAFTRRSMASLENDIVFHKGIINHPYSSAEQRNFSQKMIESCLLRLAEIKGEQGMEQATGA